MCLQNILRLGYNGSIFIAEWNSQDTDIVRSTDVFFRLVAGCFASLGYQSGDD